jgi:hypothetical protein
MSDDLRTRIMDVLVGDEAKGHAYIPEAAAWAIADALIRELGLTREDNGRLGVSAPYRYVTEWTTDG